MTIQELKAHAFDCQVNIQTWQRELQATVQKIDEELHRAEKKDTKEEKGEKE